MGSLDDDAAIVTAGGLRPGLIADVLAAMALAGTILANMALKLGITLVYARSADRQAVSALGFRMVAAALILGWLSRPT